MIGHVTLRMSFASSCICLGAIASLIVGCDEPALAGTSPLGIVGFHISETTDRITVIGVDTDQKPVAMLDLFHGRFTLSDSFAAELNPGESRDVDGRKVYVEALGQRMRWEAIGYRPTLQMPSPPVSQWALAAFVADPAVKSVLLRWGIGFRSSEELAASTLGGEIAYGTYPSGRGSSKQRSCSVTGTHPLYCQPGTPGICWNGYDPSVMYTRSRVCADRTLNAGTTVHRDQETWPDADVHGEVMLSECCTDASNGRNFFNVMSCTNDGLASGFSSCEVCIPGSGSCHVCWPCFEIEYSESCEVFFKDAHLYDATVGAKAWHACYEVEVKGVAEASGKL